METPKTTDDARWVEVGDERIPALGLGTWEVEGEACVEAVADALDRGYRHIDTAEAYGNEEEVGRGIRRSGVDRDEIFVTTKVWWRDLSHEDCLRAAGESLRRLGLERLDLLLIHWPDPDVPVERPLEAMQTLREEGKLRHLGVSNFTPSLLEEALEHAPVVCNQVEYHPFLAQDSLLALAREHGLLLTAYSPLARGRVMEDGTLREIGAEHGKTPAQVTLRWLVQQDRLAAIPRARSADHRRENLEIFDFELSDEEMARIAALDEGLRLIDPDFAPEWER
jgi:2,5-diketo-D-gluconate reductase B